MDSPSRALNALSRTAAVSEATQRPNMEARIRIIMERGIRVRARTQDAAACTAALRSINSCATLCVHFFFCLLYYVSRIPLFCATFSVTCASVVVSVNMQQQLPKLLIISLWRFSEQSP